jgi:chain length determinant protein (polysaccharide antigen chain regulator)
MYQTGSITRSGGITTQGSTSPLYFRGAKALNAEIIVLNNRSSDDPYIPELMTLVKQKEWLTSLLVKDKKARVIGDYEPSYPNTKQVYPKPIPVLIIATLIGIILGMITILAMQVISEKAQLLPRSFSRFT